MQEENKEKRFDQYAILEIMGKVRLGGRVLEEKVFGVEMIRIDIPADPDWKEFHIRQPAQLTAGADAVSEAIEAQEDEYEYEERF